MCGITAIISSQPEDHLYLESMTNLLKHRGPDSFGSFQDGLVSLGHRRLAIIDLSEAGRQPMHNEDGTIHLICNGEIYNYRVIRSDLKAKGHQFKSQSDCETLIHLYEEYNDKFLDYVNGMFAFVIWDEKKKRLLAAVDRFGKKPLYYANVQGRIALASEMKSLLLFPWVKKEIDPLAIDRYLSLRYVPAPRTILKSVRKIEPATMMIYEGENIRITRYWKARRMEQIPYVERAVDSFAELFTDAVGMRLQSDVPLGIYLSGGVDSSAVAGIMRSLSGEEKKISFTLSIDYEFNEQEKANQIAQYLNFEFNPVIVRKEDFDLLPSIMFHLDEPFGDLLSIPAYILAQKAKEKLTVTLTGDGADEILNGYFHQKIMGTWNRWKGLLRMPGISQMLSEGVGFIPVSFLDLFFDYPDHLGKQEKIKLSQTLSRCRRFGTFYEGVTSCFTAEDKFHLYTPSLSARVMSDPLSEEFQKDVDGNGDFSFFSRLSLLDLKYWIPFSVIFRLDKLNMAHAVETRSPFLDFRLVEMALNLADEAKFNKRQNKVILRRLMERIFPPHLRQKGKQAFYMPLPLQYWQKFYEWVNGLLTRQSIEKRGLFQWSYVQGLIAILQKEQDSMLVKRQLTTLAMLELWFRIFAESGKDAISAHA